MTQRLKVNSRHQVREVDPETRMGVCSRCGPTTAYKSGTYRGAPYWRCGTLSKAYASARCMEPEVSQANRNARFLRLYGITVEEYDEMLAEQGGTCARCQEEPQETLRLAVDHNHETGVVRKLLCGPCNTYLGRLEANRHRLMEDLEYLDSGSFGFAGVIAQNL